MHHCWLWVAERWKNEAWKNPWCVSLAPHSYLESLALQCLSSTFEIFLFQIHPHQGFEICLSRGQGRNILVDEIENIKIQNTPKQLKPSIHWRIFLHEVWLESSRILFRKEKMRVVSVGWRWELPAWSNRPTTSQCFEEATFRSWGTRFPF